MKNLLDSKLGQLCIIKGFDKSVSIKIKRRLLELGFTKGQSVKILRKSLLKKAFLIQIRGYTLTIRRDIAQLILI